MDESVEAQRKLEELIAELGPRLTRSQMVGLMQKILNAEGSDTEERAWLGLLERNVAHPALTDLIYYPAAW